MWLADNQLSEILRPVFKCLQYFIFIIFYSALLVKRRFYQRHENSDLFSIFFTSILWKMVFFNILFFVTLWVSCIFVCFSLFPWICIKRLKKKKKKKRVKHLLILRPFLSSHWLPKRQGFIMETQNWVWKYNLLPTAISSGRKPSHFLWQRSKKIFQNSICWSYSIGTVLSSHLRLLTEYKLLPFINWFSLSIFFLNPRCCFYSGWVNCST